MLERGFRSAQQLIENGTPDRQFAIQRSIEMLEATGVVDPKFDLSQAIKTEAARRIDIRQRAYYLLSQVREPSDEEEKALEMIGIKFFPIARISYAQVVADNPEHFWDKELEYATARPELK